MLMKTTAAPNATLVAAMRKKTFDFRSIMISSLSARSSTQEMAAPRDTTGPNGSGSFDGEAGRPSIYC